MFGSDDDDDSATLGDVTDAVRAKISRTQEDACDFCGATEGSKIVAREETHPDVDSSPPVVRCKACYNDPDTYPDDG